MVTLKKRDGESRTYTFQFQYETEIEAGDTIASVTSVSAANANGGTGTLPTCATGAIVNTSRDVTSVISGGVTGNVYLLKCKVLTAGGSILERLGLLAVNDA